MTSTGRPGLRKGGPITGRSRADRARIVGGRTKRLMSLTPATMRRTARGTRHHYHSTMAAKNRDDVHEFLKSRRSRIKPEAAGITTGHGLRRVAGLRRDEVALLAGVSVEYYARLERGDLHGVSDSVLNAIADALKFDEAERAHLFDLAAAAGPISRKARPHTLKSVRPIVQQILMATETPAYARNYRFDLLDASPLGRLVFTELFAGEMRPPNLARYMFLDPAARSFFIDWESVASETVAALRTEKGRRSDDHILDEQIRDLRESSSAFRDRWDDYAVSPHLTGHKLLNHPTLGLLELTGLSLQVADIPDLRIIAYTAPPNSDTATRLRMLSDQMRSESGNLAPEMSNTADRR